MKYITVDLCEEFECIADACPNTCCIGWEIGIDTETYEKMVEQEEKLGVKSQDWLIETKDSIRVKMKDFRCPMLNEKNLCNVVLKLGPEYLSYTCQTYPRVRKQYGSVLEGYLSISCPEVVAKLMNKEMIEFDFVEDTIPTPPYEYEKLYLFESYVRGTIIDILQGLPDFKLCTRLYLSYKILEYAIQFYQKGQMDSNSFSMEIQKYFQEEYLLMLDAQLYQMLDKRKQYDFLKKFIPLIDVADGRDLQFVPVLEEAIAYFEENSYEDYREHLEKFQSALESYHTFYSNYWVYRNFSSLLQIPDYSTVKEKFFYVAVEFCFMQLLLLPSFVKNNKIDQQEYIYIISRLSRKTMHNSTFFKQTMEELKKNNLVSAAGLLFLII